MRFLVFIIRLLALALYVVAILGLGVIMGFKDSLIVVGMITVGYLLFMLANKLELRK